MSTYSQKLRDQRWIDRRNQIVNQHNECTNCGIKDTCYNVHHKVYLKGRQPWEYDDEQLECLCRKCHTEKHKSIDYLVNLIKMNDIICSEIAGFIYAISEKYDIDVSISKFRENLLVGYEFVEGYVHGKKSMTPVDFFDAAKYLGKDNE